jgi:hypothetical protein
MGALDDAFGSAAVKQHAKLSPSSSHRWAVCHAAPQREAKLHLVRETNFAADEGTIMHDLGEKTLVAGDDRYLRMALGKEARVDSDGTVVYFAAGNGGIVITEDMIECVESYVAFVRELAIGGELHVEQRLSIEHITGEPGAKGTSDTVVVFPKELAIADLKGGFGKVLAKKLLPTPITLPNGVVATHKPNTQLVMYGEAVRKEMEFFHEFEQVRIIIVQPRLSHVDEHVIPIDEFMGWVEWLRIQAEATRGPSPKAVPSEDTCQWCRAFPCEDAQALALSEAIDDFEDKPRVPPIDPVELGRRKQLVPFIRQYCDWIDSRVRGELEAGRPVDGFKLVEGDMGDRKWTSEAAVIEKLQGFELTADDYETRKLVSPAAVEKLVIRKRKTPNKKLTTDQWDQLQELIKRDEGSPKVVPNSDPRPALSVNPADDFNFD